MCKEPCKECGSSWEHGYSSAMSNMETRGITKKEIDRLNGIIAQQERILDTAIKVSASDNKTIDALTKALKRYCKGMVQ